ncbi:MAG: hypothetical protein KF852_19140 [Saprospiraceae bacterium]|nr:hypothetical protein [Saprospiraceae bacterium]
MRIVGTIEHPVMKITIFRNDNRLSVKFESGLCEQTYKFRDGEGADSAEDVHRIVDAAFAESVLGILQQMQAARSAALARQIPSGEEEEFEEIV